MGALLTANGTAVVLWTAAAAATHSGGDSNGVFA
jgi:hypothetical protein